MTATWDGITKSETLNNWVVEIRHKLADAAKAYDWKRTLEILNQHPECVNVTRLDGRALYTPLHQAAHGGAPVEVVQQMLAMGAWRTLRNANNQRPVDIARERSHHHLIPILEPVYKKQISLQTLQRIQEHFHAVIRERVGTGIESYALRLPELEPLLEMKNSKIWFPVPGMYGGFNYWLEGEESNTQLVVKSWCRVVEGSGQRHEITSEGSQLVDKGFV